MMKRYLLHLFACFAISAGALACGDNADQTNNGNNADECQAAEDCADEEQCISGTCERESLASCETDFECADYEYCAEGTCQFSTCSDDAECAGDSICENSQCRPGCRDSGECADGERCSETSWTCEQVGCTPGSCNAHEVCDQEQETPECVPDGSCSDNLHCTRYERHLEDGIDYICEEGDCIERPPCESDDVCDTGEICIDGDCVNGCREDNHCLPDEYCDEEDFSCVEGCNSDEDCGEDGICIDFGGGERVCKTFCTERETCEDADGGVDGMVCRDSYCQFCESDDDCLGVEFCDMEDAEGAPEGRGICRELPPECPSDEFEDNHSQENAEVIDDFPFERVETDEGDERPILCNESTAGEWFEVTAEPGKVIVAEIEYDNSDGANLDLALVNGAGNELTQSTRRPDGPGSDDGIERIEYGVNPNRSDDLTAYVQIRGTIVDATIPYSIMVDVRDPEPCTDDDYEENDTADEAAPLPAENGLQVCGDDVDWYTVDLPPNHILEVSLEAPHRLGDVDIYLFEEPENPGDDPTVSVAESESTNDSELLQYDSTDGGTFLVLVDLKQGVGNATYDIDHLILESECVDSAEINDTCGEATEVSDGTVYDGPDSLNICEDNDYYRIVLNPLDRLTVTATFDPAESAGEMQMTLFGRDRENPFADSCGNFLDSADESIDSDTGEVSLVIEDFEAELGGEFYILTSRFSGIRVPYDLEFDVEPGEVCDDDRFDENGGNDTPETAVVLEEENIVGNGPQAALVGQRICDANEDWFEITLDDEQEVVWAIEQDRTAGAIGAEVFLDDGTTPATDESGDPIVLGTSDDELTVTNTTGGEATYYLRIAGQDGIPVRNNYWLLTTIDEQGPIDSTCPDVYEDNDTDAEAVLLEEGNYDNLLICTDDEGGGDWYRTEVAAGQTITVSAIFDDPEGNATLHLYSQDDRDNDLLRATSTDDVYTGSYTSARDQEIYYRVDTGSGTDGDVYTLDVNISEAQLCDDDRFGDISEPALAEEVDAPGLYMRLMTCDYAADWFAVDLEEGDEFEAYLNYDHDRADIDVQVFDVADASATPVATGDESATYTAADDATHYVRVASADEDMAVRLPYDLLLYRDDEGPEDQVCPDAFEDNDNSSQAAPIPAGSYSDLRLCAGNPSDDDYYSVYVPAGATVDVDITFDPEHNLDLTLSNESGNLVDDSQSPVGVTTESVSATNDSSVGAEYTVHVDGGTSTYETFYEMDVSLEFSTECEDDDFAPNHDMDAADTNDPLAVGAYELTLCEPEADGERRDDWFRVELGAGEQLEAHIELRNRLGNVDMELVDAAGEQVEESTTSENVESLTYTNDSADTDETVYLHVFAQDGSFIRNDYDLWLSVGDEEPEPQFCPDPYERNDDTDSSYQLEFDQEPQLVDAIMCNAEQDWYQVDLEANEVYEWAVFFDHADDFDLALEVRDGNGNPIEDVDQNLIEFAEDSEDDDELATFAPDSDGTYFLGVTQQGDDEFAQGDYFMSFIDQSTSCQDDEFAPNDSYGTAAELSEAGAYALTNCNLEEEWYQYTATTDGPLTFTIYYDESELELTGYRDSPQHSLDTESRTNRATVTVPADEVSAGQIVYLYVEGTSGSGPYFLTVEE